MKRTALWFAALALGALALSGCGRDGTSPSTTGSVVRISQRNEPEDLDPALASIPDSFFVIRALSEGLVLPTATGPVPGAAERWEVSPDGTTYTFHLREGALWSDGEPVTAEDFIASYRRLLTPSTAAPKAELFYPVRNARDYVAGRITDFTEVGFRAADPRTLVITLERPAPRFLDYAASGPWMPASPGVVARWGRQWTRPGHHVGNGPFVLSEWLPNQRITVTRNPRYWDWASVRLDSIQFVRLDDGESEERAYRAGDIDVTLALPYTKLETYERERPADVHRLELGETRYLSFNTRRPPLDDPRVRQALSLAIDRERIVTDVLRGDQPAAARLLAPALLGSAGSGETPAGPPASGDPAAAARLLAQAGFPGGRGFPRLELSGWSATPVLEAIQAMWRKALGIEVSVSVREARVHVAALRSGAYDIALVTLIPDVADPLAALENFSSSSPGNYPHWSDIGFDKLLAGAASAGTPAQRSAFLFSAEKRLLEAQPLAPLYFNVKIWAMRPAVTGWEEDALWNRTYSHLGLGLPSGPAP